MIGISFCVFPQWVWTKRAKTTSGSELQSKVRGLEAKWWWVTSCKFISAERKNMFCCWPRECEQWRHVLTFGSSVKLKTACVKWFSPTSYYLKTCYCHLHFFGRPALTCTSWDNVWVNHQRLEIPLDAATSWVRTWRSEMTWMEGNGSSARVGRRDTNSLVSVSRACLSVSPQTKTSFCLGLQERTTGKVMNLTKDMHVWLSLCHVIFGIFLTLALGETDISIWGL